MKNYLIGTDMLVDCVERGRQFARGESVGASHETFTVNSKTRGTDVNGAGTYVLHGVGNAAVLAPGQTLYTPDHIIWDVISIDVDKKGVTVSKKRDDVSFAAWLTGDWSTLTGDTPVFPPSLAQQTAKVIEEGKSTFTSVLPWVIGGAIVVGAVAVAAPLVAPLITARMLKGRS